MVVWLWSSMWTGGSVESVGGGATVLVGLVGVGVGVGAGAGAGVGVGAASAGAVVMVSPYAVK